jgi:hypothetical protein
MEQVLTYIVGSYQLSMTVILLSVSKNTALMQGSKCTEALWFKVSHLNLAPLNKERQKNSSWHGRCAGLLFWRFVGGVLDFWPECTGIMYQKRLIYWTWDWPKEHNKMKPMRTQEEELAWKNGAEFTISVVSLPTNQSSPSSMGLTALPNAGGQRACLSLWFQSVRMVVQRSCCGLNWVTNVVSQPIPDWGSWFTVAESAKVDLISLPSEFVLVLRIATDEYTGLARSFGCIGLQSQRALAAGTITVAWSMSHKAWETMLGIFRIPTERRFPMKLNVAFYCLHQREGG